MNDERGAVSLLGQLRDATRSLHEAVEREAHMARLVAPDLTRAEYAATLARLHAYYRPLETRLQPHAPALPLLLLDRSARLRRDLAALGVVPTAEDAPVPDVPTDAAALGVLYVLEGAALGGQVIARAVTASLGLTPAYGLAFFSSEGLPHGPRWRTFSQVLAEMPGSDAVVSAAVSTFSTLFEWMTLHP